MSVCHKLLMRLLLLGSRRILIHIALAWAEGALTSRDLLATSTSTDSTDTGLNLVLEALDSASLLRQHLMTRRLFVICSGRHLIIVVLDRAGTLFGCNTSGLLGCRTPIRVLTPHLLHLRPNILTLLHATLHGCHL